MHVSTKGQGFFRGQKSFHSIKSYVNAASVLVPRYRL